VNVKNARKINTDKTELQIMPKTLLNISIIGPDKKGIVAKVTKQVFLANGNIEDINQTVIKNTFYMNLKVSFKKTIDKEQTIKKFKTMAKGLEMECKTKFISAKKRTNIAILVTREEHVLLGLIKKFNTKSEKGNIVITIGTTKELEKISESNKIPFKTVDDSNQTQREKKILELLEEYDVDLIILARYMKILSPNFVWRYENRIINIHPSILPAFPGALAYAQAFERGVKISGATAHFVTTELDQGPIICQESFQINQSESLREIKERGKKTETQVMIKAVKLFLENKLSTHWGKVYNK